MLAPLLALPAVQVEHPLFSGALPATQISQDSKLPDPTAEMGLAGGHALQSANVLSNSTFLAISSGPTEALCACAASSRAADSTDACDIRLHVLGAGERSATILESHHIFECRRATVTAISTSNISAASCRIQAQTLARKL